MPKIRQSSFNKLHHELTRLRPDLRNSKMQKNRTHWPSGSSYEVIGMFEYAISGK